jgi:hypothetical protein
MSLSELKVHEIISDGFSYISADTKDVIPETMSNILGVIGGNFSNKDNEMNFWAMDDSGDVKFSFLMPTNNGEYAETLVMIDNNGALYSSSVVASSEIESNNLTIYRNTDATTRTGINCQYNTGGYHGLSDDGFNSVKAIIELSQSLNGQVTNNEFITIDIEFDFAYNYDNNTQMYENYGRTSLIMQLYPGRFFNNMGVSTEYNINNKINGDTSYTYINSSYAPKGRPYYTNFINQGEQIEGLSGVNAELLGDTTSMGIFFTNPNPGYNWSKNLTVKIVNSECAMMRNTDTKVSVVQYS